MKKQNILHIFGLPPGLCQQVKVVVVDSPHGYTPEMVDKLGVLGDADGVISLGLYDHFSVHVFIIVIFYKHVILESVPVHEQVPVAPPSLYADIVVRFEFHSEVVVDLIVGDLQRIRERNLPLPNQSDVRPLDRWEQPSNLRSVYHLL